MKLRYDLHLHSCLSPCGDDEMTPASIAGMAKLNGADLIALTDHNSAKNLPAMAQAAARYGILLLPGIEVNTREEIHLLGYFPSVEAALDMGERLYSLLPALPWKEEVFGRQLIVDSEDRQTGRVEKLLLGAVDLSLEEAAAEIVKRGGVAVPAHLDRDSYSALSVLGFLPDPPLFKAVELSSLKAAGPLEEAGRLPPGLELLSSSDAHYLWAMRQELLLLNETSVLWPLVEQL